jgi:hypothetical protein
MSIGVTAAVPTPSALLNGEAPGYRRWRAYLNPTTGVVEGSRLEIRAYNGRGSATVAGGVYLLQFDGDEETSPRVFTCAAQAADVWVVVSPGILADATWGWFALEGFVDALVEGTQDVAKDDTLKVVTATSPAAFIQDTAAMVVTTDSVAVACAGQTSATPTLTKVQMFGQRADVD